MLSNWFLRSFRILLFPFAILYWLAILLRNWFYDKAIFKTVGFGLPIICIGNLSVGGTGKSPMVEFLIRLLKDHYKVATLSRGYKRKTKGYALATETTTAIDIGDEPMQFHKKFAEIAVAVGEERIEAIPQLLHDRPDTEVIILDDAFQHRAIQAGLNILLTDYGNLFTRDFYLPTGDLRDLKSSYKRAEIVIVSKCKPDLDEAERRSLTQEINPQPYQHLFFTTIIYGTPFHIMNGSLVSIDEQTEVLLITGIANPGPLKEYLEGRLQTYNMMQYADHHIFTIDDLNDIKRRFERMDTANKIIITTEKDAVRLLKFTDELNGLPFYVLPIEHRFLFGGGTTFASLVINYITQFQTTGRNHG
jgi:tetraacyldisaccharide 4'-kinase